MLEMKAAQGRSLKEAILIGGGAILVLLIVLLLVSLKITPVEEAELEPVAPARARPQPRAPLPQPAVLARPDPGVGSETEEIREAPRRPVPPLPGRWHVPGPTTGPRRLRRPGRRQ